MPLTNVVHAHCIWCVSHHLLRQIHLGELSGEQQVLGRDRRSILRGGIQQLLQPTPLPVVRMPLLGLCHHLLLCVAGERRLAVQAAATADRPKKAGH